MECPDCGTEMEPVGLANEPGSASVSKAHLDETHENFMKCPNPRCGTGIFMS